MSYNTIVTTTGNGTTKQFSVPFPYIQKADVKVFLDNVEYPSGSITWVNSGLLELAAAPASGVHVMVRRLTDASSLVSVFSPGPVGSSDLNRVLQQLLYVSQEASDAGNSYVAEALTGILATVTEAAAAAATEAANAAIDVIVGFDPSEYYTKVAVDGLISTVNTALDGKAPTSHTHSQSQITGLETALSGKASTSHTHAIADVSGLQTALTNAQNTANSAASTASSASTAASSALSTANAVSSALGSKVSIDPGAGGVGMDCTMYVANSGVNAGATIAGSSLRFLTSSGGSAPGTWREMAGNNTSVGGTSSFRRIA